jgi:hypothetical protein
VPWTGSAAGAFLFVWAAVAFGSVIGAAFHAVALWKQSAKAGASLAVSAGAALPGLLLLIEAGVRTLIASATTQSYMQVVEFATFKMAMLGVFGGAVLLVVSVVEWAPRRGQVLLDALRAGHVVAWAASAFVVVVSIVDI